MKQVARDLNVRFIVEGSVRRMGTRIRITAQLIDDESGSHIWAEKFDRESAELFAVQDQVVQTIVSTLVGRVHGSLHSWPVVMLGWPTATARESAQQNV